ncbi:beta-N-acetylhexosaminidase [Microbacterium sp. BWT-B31]|uniref:beta-N-acetylhexosaminidase n=1 Tax=Microbacterium sp. BWT-B31 TaxID=3232072 RepID=UPI0035298D71
MNIPIDLIPTPTSLTRGSGAFELTGDCTVRAEGRAAQAAETLASLIERSTGIRFGETSAAGPSIEYRLADRSDLGVEGYELTIEPTGIRVTAHRPAGLGMATQTIVQLLDQSTGRASLPAVTISDIPRFSWRGIMLDVSRHFFDVDVVKHVIDMAARYKLNVLHLHLSDDQGWRIAIDSWPDLQVIGSATQVGGGVGGCYTKADYAEIVEYAARLFITVVPEIDVPGHTNAALTAYPVLNSHGRAAAPYTGVKGGFSTLAPDNAHVQAFITDVFTEMALITPGPYIHFGGDEVDRLCADDYGQLVQCAYTAIAAVGKTPVGWQEAARAGLPADVVVHYWDSRVDSDDFVSSLTDGARLILSPGNRAYFDMKYDQEYPRGLDWAGPVGVRQAYEWNPADVLAGVGEEAILGVEAALWTETVSTRSEIDEMLLPRLPALAEVAWASAQSHSWTDFAGRVGRHRASWERDGWSFHPSAEIPWP